jgi:SAM-dependent methyltransferase
MSDSNVNTAQREHWNAVAGPKWRRNSDKLDRQLELVGRLLLERARPRLGEAVLEIGCGTGSTLVHLMEMVGPQGRIVGIDIAEPMLAMAQERVAGGAMSSTVLILGDAQVHTFVPGSFDLLVSRFGVMFFEDPIAAFRNLRRALRAGGRLCFVCWAALQENPHWAISLDIAARRLGPPAEKPPRAPGPLAFSDPIYLRRILEDAGFAAIRINRETCDLIGLSPQAEAAFVSTMGPAGSLIAEREPPNVMLEEIRTEIAAAFEQFRSGERTLFPASLHLVEARSLT